MPHVKTGYQGARDKGGVKRVYTLPELVGEGSKFGFDLRKWDGKAPIPVLDELGRVFAACIGQPNDAGWSAVSRDAAADIAAARDACKFPSGCRKHRRGDFPVLAVAVSYGGGQKRPGNLVNSRRNARALRILLRTRALRRIAGFASGGFAYWHPRLHPYYHDRLGSLFQHHPRLQRNFDNSVFACATVNFGPRTCC
ncbi:hypothetical protein FIBSPDRAFT_970041 [Athelia psychrophila]|uniref:Uncharacterized protein n=1 Tax=Athelia psychrophila TaxID=1759441 RepID=A0A167SZD4_9AGAM|nr:hypothetical protein FIBSPDRAFT_970041 [Fibularhizoctonia sp. CBS 109695]